MFPTDSSTSASSPFSSRSTIASSPEVMPSTDQTGQNGQKNGQSSTLPPPELTQGMQQLMYNNFTSGSFQNFAPNFSPPRTSPPFQPPPSSTPAFNTDLSSLDARLAEAKGNSPAAPESTAGSARHGSRSDPPKRKIEVEGLPVLELTGQELAKTPAANILLLQGDPQTIAKQRVETAIRVIIDLLHQIPASPSSPRLHPSLTPFLHRDSNGNFLTTLARIGTFHSIRLQAGTTTKSSSKKQMQAGPTPQDSLLYLETAVYMSGENGRRVYVCNRCRSREAKRRQSKDAARKKQHSNSGSESSATKMRKPNTIGPAPSEEYITGENPEQYDPLRSSQLVEEPSWDPVHPDWRHEIVLFNSPPEVSMKEGSCVWLPFRVVCYGKCHGEKVGFKVRFTLRTQTGSIIASAITNPIRITDDHKTDAKTKPRVDGMTSGNAAVPRARKGRASVASSLRVSPTPSDVESIQSVSEAGAVVQKQTPSVRAGKPYERPPSQSPLNAPLNLNGNFPGAPPMPMDMSAYQRTQPNASHYSGVSGVSPAIGVHQQGDIMSQNNIGASEFPMFNRGTNGTISPGSLRHPNFDFTSLDGSNSNARSVSQSATSSNVASPISVTQPLDASDALLFSGNHQSPSELISALNFSSLNALNQRQNLGPSTMFTGYPSDGADVDMSNAISAGLDNIFDTSSHASLASSFNDDASAFSGNLPEGSLFSDSGVVPEDMQGFLDFTGGEGASPIQNLNQPNFFANSPLANTRDLSPMEQMEHDRQVEEMIHALAGQGRQPYSPVPPVPPPQPAANAPIISTVIPAEGPMAGGTTVAIIGANFTPGLVVLFGDRTAKIQRIDPTFIQCQAPPAAVPGLVEVNIAGAMRMPGAPPSLFKYNMMDTDLMMLALQVKGQYAGASTDAAYRLAQQIAARSANPAGQWPDQSNPNLSNFGPSPDDADSKPADLQKTIIDFLAALDADAPGSLRRSGAVNHKTDVNQTLLHIAAITGFHRLVRRLVVIGAHLDIQDVNGYTALGLAALVGQTNSVRVLMEAGASYDRPTVFGEMPLDLAKVGEHVEVESLLLSAVWSTEADHREASVTELESISARSEIDEDNPSDASDDEDRVSTMMKPKKVSRKARGKQRAVLSRSSTTDQRKVSPRPTLAATPLVTPAVQPADLPQDDPPPYDTLPSPLGAGWMSRTLSNSGNFKLPVPEAVYNRLPTPISSLLGDKPPVHDGWIAFSAPSWETLTKVTSPEEVKLFTQAMAAAAFNAVVQSGVTTSAIMDRDEPRQRQGHRRRRSSRSRSDRDEGDVSGSPGKKIAKQVKRDRMLYLFWLPILLFVGFWLLVTALPLITGICLIYGRQIFRAVKQRIS